MNYNPRTRSECVTFVNVTRFFISYYNSRTCLECVYHQKGKSMSPFYYNSRTRSECVVKKWYRDQAALVLQSSHPLGVRLFITESINDISKLQSSHPLGVRRHLVLKSN